MDEGERGLRFLHPSPRVLSFTLTLSQSFSSFNIPFPCIVPVLENICIFHSVLFYFILFSFRFFRNDLSSDRNKTRHVRPPCPKGLKRDRVRVSSTIRYAYISKPFYTPPPLFSMLLLLLYVQCCR